MAIKQLTVFVENKQGALVSITETLSKHNINLRAMSIAETRDFGILRLIANDEEKVEQILTEEGYLIKITEVIGVKIIDEPGKLSEALKVLSDNGINVEYLYAFMTRSEDHAYVVIRVEDNEAAEKILEDEGFQLIAEEDISKL